MAETAAERGLIDTSVVIALDPRRPRHSSSADAVAPITLAELAAGTHATNDLTERARRQERLQLTEARFDAIPPFDADCLLVSVAGISCPLVSDRGLCRITFFGGGLGFVAVR